MSIDSSKSLSKSRAGDPIPAADLNFNRDGKNESLKKMVPLKESQSNDESKRTINQISNQRSSLAGSVRKKSDMKCIRIQITEKGEYSVIQNQRSFVRFAPSQNTDP
jgi:hypothetical protein